MARLSPDAGELDSCSDHLRELRNYASSADGSLEVERAGDHLDVVEHARSMAVEAILMEGDIWGHRGRDPRLEWTECLDTLRNLHLNGFLLPSFVMSRATREGDGRAFVCKAGGQVLSGVVSCEPLLVRWVPHCLFPYCRDVYLGVPFVESGAGLEESSPYNSFCILCAVPACRGG